MARKQQEFFNVDKFYSDNYKSNPIQKVVAARVSTRLSETYVPKYKMYFSTVKTLRNNSQF